MKKSDGSNYSEKETKERFDAMLKGALKSPPKPLKSINKKTATSHDAAKKNNKNRR